MKELTIVITDTETGETRKEEFVVSDDTLPEAAATLTLKNAYTATDAQRGGMELARALGGTRKKEDKKS